MGVADHTKGIALAFGAATAASVLFYLHKKGKLASLYKCCGSKCGSQKQKKDLSKDELLVILSEVAASQEKMKALMTKLIAEALARDNPTMTEMYDIVNEQTPDDPLEKVGLSVDQFDSILNDYQGDSDVNTAIMKLMGGESETKKNKPSQKVKAFTSAKLIELHKFMLEELNAVLPEAEKMKSADKKNVAVSAQAIVGAKVQAKYGLTPDDVDACIQIHQQTLETSETFATIAFEVSTVMERISSN